MAISYFGMQLDYWYLLLIYIDNCLLFKSLLYNYVDILTYQWIEVLNKLMGHMAGTGIGKLADLIEQVMQNQVRMLQDLV